MNIQWDSRGANEIPDGYNAIGLFTDCGEWTGYCVMRTEHDARTFWQPQMDAGDGKTMTVPHWCRPTALWAYPEPHGFELAKQVCERHRERVLLGIAVGMPEA